MTDFHEHLQEQFEILQLNGKDQRAVRQFLQKDVCAQQHLGWQHALTWLGYQPFLGLMREGELSGVLACPPDEDGVTWLRLFAAARQSWIGSVWTMLWPAARAWLEEKTTIEFVNTLLVEPWLQGLLESSGFTAGTNVVVLAWEDLGVISEKRIDAIQPRSMREDDFLQVYEIDQVAFKRPWRNSLSQIERAFRASAIATVAELEGRVIAYQISTASSRGGHLARLAVEPGFQQHGIGSALVVDVLERFLDQGVVRVTVNTQEDNQASLELYRKLGFRRTDEEYAFYQYPLER